MATLLRLRPGQQRWLQEGVNSGLRFDVYCCCFGPRFVSWVRSRVWGWCRRSMATLLKIPTKWPSNVVPRCASSGLERRDLTAVVESNHQNSQSTSCWIIVIWNMDIFNIIYSLQLSTTFYSPLFSCHFSATFSYQTAPCSVPFPSQERFVWWGLVPCLWRRPTRRDLLRLLVPQCHNQQNRSWVLHHIAPSNFVGQFWATSWNSLRKIH